MARAPYGALEAMRMSREAGPMTLPEWALVTGLIAAGIGLDDAALAAFDTLPEPDPASLLSRFDSRQLVPRR